jgi:hypothetical protein
MQVDSASTRAPSTFSTATREPSVIEIDNDDSESNKSVDDETPEEALGTLLFFSHLIFLIAVDLVYRTLEEDLAFSGVWFFPERCEDQDRRHSNISFF